MVGVGRFVGGGGRERETLDLIQLLIELHTLRSRECGTPRSPGAGAGAGAGTGWSGTGPVTVTVTGTGTGRWDERERRGHVHETLERD